MKITDILATASANLWRNKGRSILTIIAIFVGSVTISLTLGVKAGVNDYVEKQLTNAGGKDTVTISKMLQANTKKVAGVPEYDENQSSATLGKITAKDVEQLKKISALKDVQPLESFSIEYITTKGAKRFTLDAQNVLSSSQVDLMLGRQPKKTTDALEIVLPKDYVKALGFKNAQAALNKQVDLAAKQQVSGEIQTIPVKIVGIRNKSLIQSNVAIVSVGTVKAIKAINETNLPDNLKANYYIVTARLRNKHVDVTDLKQKLSAKGYDLTTIEDQINSVKELVSATTGVLTLFGAIALLAASFGIINTLYMAVKERTREIGLMKAMGMSSSKLFLSFSTEALLLGFWGSFLGVMGAFISSFVINNVAVKSFLTGLDGFTLVQITLKDSLLIILIIMMIAFLAGTLPALRAAKLNPIVALRYE